MKQNKVLLLSNFTIGSLQGFLKTSGLEVQVAPLGDIYNSLLRFDTLYNTSGIDYIVIWAEPQQLFHSITPGSSTSPQDFKAALQQEIDHFAQALNAHQALVKGIFVVSFSVPARLQAFSLLNYEPGAGITYKVACANNMLAEALTGQAGICMLDSAPWTALNKKNESLWYMGRIPYSNEVFKAASADIAFAIDTLEGRSAKLLVLDLDNTLWGGVLGDDGYQHLQLGGGAPAGEAFCAFQEEVKRLKENGLILAIVSKNDEQLALEAMNKLPEMVLKPADFVTWRINWQDKATNIRDIIDEINISDRDVIFIDDSPAERAMVKHALPDIHVPDFPASPLLLSSFILNLKRFDSHRTTQEDRDKTTLYQAEQQRRKQQTHHAFLEDCIRDMQIQITVEPVGAQQVTRVAQLLNKTNQFNLQTRRRTEHELTQWLAQPGHVMYAAVVKDKFGNYGLTAVLSLQIADGLATITDFVMSCRILGRHIEQTLIATLINIAQSHEALSVAFPYLPTERNTPCLEALAASALNKASDTLFTWEFAETYPTPGLHTLAFSTSSAYFT